MLVVVGIIAAAAIAFVVPERSRDFVRHDAVIGASSLDLVAARPIQKGTTGDAIRAQPGYTRLAAVPAVEVLPDAVVTPSTLAGKVAVRDIPAGRQLTSGDFAAATVGGPNPGWRWGRAVVISPSSPEGLGSRIVAGSRVDVWVVADDHGSRALRELERDMRVLGADAAEGTVTLAATPSQAGELIYAAANGRLVVRLRQEREKAAGAALSRLGRGASSCASPAPAAGWPRWACRAL